MTSTSPACHDRPSPSAILQNLQHTTARAIRPQQKFPGANARLASTKGTFGPHFIDDLVRRVDLELSFKAFPTQAYTDGHPAWMKKLRQSAGFISSVAMAQALHRPSSVRLASLRKMFLNLAKACSIGSRSGL